MRLGAELDDRDAAAGRELPLAHAAEVRRALLEVVVGVAGEDQVHRLGQLGIVGGGEHGAHVGEPFLPGLPDDVVVHAFVDVHRVDAPLGPDRARQPEGEVAAAGAEVGDLRARRQREVRDHALGLLPLVAVEALVGVALHRAAAARRGARPPTTAHAMALLGLGLRDIRPPTRSRQLTGAPHAGIPRCLSWPVDRDRRRDRRGPGLRDRPHRRRRRTARARPPARAGRGARRARQGARASTRPTASGSRTTSPRPRSVSTT